MQLLRRSAHTAGELAGKVGVSGNAVRGHLSALERDGLVEQLGTRQEWTGKPANVYRLSTEAEALFPKAYAVVLAKLLEAVAERLGAMAAEELLRTVGRQLASGGKSIGDVRHRAKMAAEFLTELGGLAEVVEDEAGLKIQGYSCPLSDVTLSHPEACKLAESLVSALVGQPVRECCQRDERPRCAFRILDAT